MEARYELRKKELLDECKVDPAIFDQMMDRLESFMTPFLKNLCRREQIDHTRTYLRGLLSDLDHKNAESIAYRFGQDRLPLQRFISWAEWDDAPMRTELAHQVGKELGEADGVIVFDPSGVPKSGKMSVGVARQWCGRLGKIENCQVAVYMGYASRIGHALVDTRLYLPKEWTANKTRCANAGVPKNRRRHHTRHQLCLEMLDEKGSLLPHSWIGGDDEFGRIYWFRHALHTRGERYMLATPSSMLIRDLDSEPPSYRGRGPYPARPWQRVDRWTQQQTNWVQLDVRDGSKGPLLVEIIKRRVVARTQERQEGHEEVLVVIRYRDRDDESVVKVDYYLSNAEPETSLDEFARVAKAEHRIEECLERGKSEVGMADYEVRNWDGWHRHQTLSLLSAWFLVTETRRGKKMDTIDHAATDSRGYRINHPPCFALWYEPANPAGTREAFAAKRTRPLISLETT
jgi:SRSO17 transposase